MRKCSTCRELKATDEFSKNKRSKSGLDYSCKECNNKRSRNNYIKNRSNNLLRYKRNSRNYYNENKSAILDRQKKYRQENKETIANREMLYRKENKEAIAKRSKIYRENNRPHTNEHRNKRYKTDPIFKIACNLRSRLYRFCISASMNKKFKTLDSTGLTATELKTYIESLFTKGMSWNNYGEWHIDHIKPLCTAKTIEDVYILNHYTNLQPLWRADNLSKGGRVSIVIK